MAILNTLKTQTDNVQIVDVTNVSHHETQNNKRNFAIFNGAGSLVQYMCI